jgi:hypothetical protein
MLAQRLPTILPPLTPVESLETMRIYSAMGRLPADELLMKRRPFRMSPFFLRFFPSADALNGQPSGKAISWWRDSV